MESNSSHGTSWADQWDYNPDPVAETTNKSRGGAKAKYSKKIEDGLGKTKAVASTGMKKVKEGTFVGLHWIKDKYQKRRPPRSTS